MAQSELLRRVISPLVLAATAEAAALLALRNFYRLLAFDAQFSQIFAQITGAELRPPIVLPLGLAVLFGRWVARRSRRQGAVIAVGMLFWLGCFVLTMALTRVNGVVFFDIPASLLPMLGAGLEVG